MKRKHMNTDNAQWKEPELTTLISEVGGSTNMQSMQARVLQYKAVIPKLCAATDSQVCREAFWHFGKELYIYIENKACRQAYET